MHTTHDPLTDRLTPDQLEQVLVAAEQRIARLRWIQVQAIRSADRQQVPLRDGCRNVDEWIRGRLDTTPETARSLSAVAALDSAELDTALEAGDVGFDRVAEAARAGDDDLAPHLDLAAMRRRASIRRRITSEDEIREFGHRSVAYQRDVFGTSGRLWAHGPALQTDAIFAAIEHAADALPAEPPGHRSPRAARRFDGLTALCLRTADADFGGRSIQTTVIVDARTAARSNGEAGAWLASGPRIGPSTLERILCESTIEVTARADDGTPLAIGDSRTAIPGRTRRWVLARDGGCVADGCTSPTRLQPHHVRPRSAGGDNDPDNLATLCWFHHHVVVHGRGFSIDPDSPPRRRRFLPPQPSRSGDPP